ncbi:MAG: DUF4190 domain-containing protein [Clostridiales bacterium]|nr:DUF4190 domain-containing protein [Clostridiales bacterium]
MDENTYVESEINEQGTNKKAIIGFVCSIIGVVLCCGFPVGIVGLVFSIMALNEIKQTGLENGKGLAIAGIVLAILSLLIIILLVGLGVITSLVTPLVEPLIYY